MFILKIISERAIADQKDINIRFIDHAKEFDKITQEELFEIFQILIFDDKIYRRLLASEFMEKYINILG